MSFIIFQTFCMFESNPLR